ncbi:MAG: hypothetical protein J5849_04915 [Clostridia bacterium]|nr:hypothetical protein [Clostridia bacterium]
MRKAASLLLLAIFVLSLLLGSCSGKTPDVVASEEAAALNLETMTWTLAVEGGNVDSYTRADAEKHDLSNMYVSMPRSCDPGSNGTGWIQMGFLVSGIPLHVFLEDVGRPDAKKVTYVGNNLYGEDISIAIEGDFVQSDDVMIGWVMNKKDLLLDSKTYVGVFGSGNSAALKDFTSCTWVSKLIIE